VSSRSAAAPPAAPPAGMGRAAQTAQGRVVSLIGLPHWLQDNDFSAKLDSESLRILPRRRPGRPPFFGAWRGFFR